MLRLILLAQILCCAFSGTGLAQSQFGRYLGTLKHSQISQDQLAKLDFIVSRQNSSEFKLIAVLSLYFGDYESKEYVSYHFDSVTYNILTGTLVFDQADQELTLLVSRFTGGRLEGTLRSVSSGNVGTLAMTQDKFATPTRPLVQALWGEYRGVCDGVGTVLQVQTHRSSNDSSRMGNPFGTYDISAQLAEVNAAGCGDEPVCVLRTYDNGSYNFFRGKLELSGRFNNLSCAVNSSGLECDSCSLQRTSNEAVDVGPKIYPQFDGGFDLASPSSNGGAVSPSSSLNGTYYGFLFHERLGVYQAVSLNIASYQGSGLDGQPALFISAVSSMFFGGFSFPEYVTHRFNEKPFPLLSPQIVLERIDGDVDAVVQLTQLGNGTARGTWNSILFGRIGTFELTNAGPPPPPANAAVMGSIAGKYESEGWSIDLRVVRESTPINTVNPFYPLNFRGAFRFGDITPNLRIAEGAYDFYTGKIGMKLENETRFSGVRTDDVHLYLKRPTPGSMRPLLPHQLKTYTKVPL